MIAFTKKNFKKYYIFLQILTTNTGKGKINLIEVTPRKRKRDAEENKRAGKLTALKRLR